jgi:hypothetical protein
MKAAIIIVSFTAFLFSCRKNMLPDNNDLLETNQVSENLQAASAASYFFYTGAMSSATAGDKGLSADADILKLSGGNYEMKSWWIAFHFTDTAGINKWTQWGYALHESFGYITIITTWSLSGGTTQIFPPTTDLNSLPFIFGGKTKFSIYNVEGTTKWRYARNNVDIEEVDLGTTSIGRIEVMIESQSPTTIVKWPQINVQNISTLRDGNWVTVSTAQFQGNTFSNTGLSIWSIEGKNQNPALQPGELNMGGNGDPVTAGTVFW